MLKRTEKRQLQQHQQQQQQQQQRLRRRQQQTKISKRKRKTRKTNTTTWTTTSWSSRGRNSTYHRCSTRSSTTTWTWEVWRSRWSASAAASRRPHPRLRYRPLVLIIIRITRLTVRLFIEPRLSTPSSLVQLLISPPLPNRLSNRVDPIWLCWPDLLLCFSPVLMLDVSNNSFDKGEKSNDFTQPI